MTHSKVLKGASCLLMSLGKELGWTVSDLWDGKVREIEAKIGSADNEMRPMWL